MSEQGIYFFISTLLDTIDIAVCLFDSEDRTISWNPAFTRFFPEHDGHVYSGEPYRENLRRFYSNRLPEEEMSNIERYIDEGVDRHRNQTRPFVFTHNGRRLRVASLQTPDGGRIRIWHELSEENSHAPDPALWNEFPIDLLDYIADGAMVLDQNDKIIAVNGEFRALYDIAPGEPIIGLTLIDIVRRAWVKSGAPGRALDVSMLDNLRFAGAPFEVELPGGRWRRVIARRTASGIGYFTHSDISLLKRALADLAAMAATDGLTGLPNRRRFDAGLDEAWQRCRREGAAISLLLVDIDHFKSVNDRFGHVVGDQCLRRTAQIVQEAVRQSIDLAARVGGEEFAVVLPDATAEGAVAVSQRIRAAMAREPWIEIHPYLASVTVSIGICAVKIPADLTVADFMRHADEALYRAKNSGRDRLELHIA
ncbi:sensor domain-containing diguanylate cyclase [Roseixanthobacter glucoisosaccharinicivorans]|uniref:sensor domain-containing diguanylate cyclase n=1 Tax=Roseixanthobacter glucoisosaccharinicivorans TaxID=3119923 RepID=UPI00372B9CB5